MHFIADRTSRNPSRAPGLALVLAAVALASACSRSTPSGQGAAPRTNASLPLTPDVYLRVDAFTIPAGTFNNTAPILMWGYSRCDAAWTCAAPTVPGPEIAVQEGGPALTIHLRNNLAATSPAGAYLEPASVMVPGQLSATGGLPPVWIDPGTGLVTSTGSRASGDYASRVRSFTAETPADGTTVVTYTFSNLKAGTYLYQTGTHPAVQLQMGLYGGLRVYPAAGLTRAYAHASSAFANEVTLLYSEIDPVLHAAVAAGHYGPNPPDPAPADWMTSPVHYRPMFFLVNGRPYSPSTAPLPAGPVGSALLIRFLNAGLQTKVPQILRQYLSLIAEDGNFIQVTSSAGAALPAPRQQYSVLLPAGKTADAILVPAAAGDIPVYDRRLSLTNGGTKLNGAGTPAQANAGMLSYLAVSGATGSLAATPNPRNFGNVARGSSATQPVTVVNNGVASRAITGAQINPSTAAFSVSTSFPIALAGGGGSATVNVTFAPTAVGLQTATLQLATNDPNTPLLSVTLRGTGQ
jgi:FtsP/CotA-like multicopper oxidase with cupredoxin domain